MPTHATVRAFVEQVESGQGLEALDRYYADHASMRENQAPPRVGKAALLAHEKAARAAVSGLVARCVRPILVDGDIVVLRWEFRYADRQGRTVRFEELAWQRWECERIVEEQFFYDPAQFKPEG